VNRRTDNVIMTDQPRNPPHRSEVYEPSNPAVAADSSRQATDPIVAPAAAAVCPGTVIRQSQSLFEDSTD